MIYFVERLQRAIEAARRRVSGATEADHKALEFRFAALDTKYTAAEARITQMGRYRDDLLTEHQGELAKRDEAMQEAQAQHSALQGRYDARDRALELATHQRDEALRALEEIAGVGAYVPPAEGAVFKAAPKIVPEVTPANTPMAPVSEPSAEAPEVIPEAVPIPQPAPDVAPTVAEGVTPTPEAIEPDETE